jgi:hypothetical protein
MDREAKERAHEQAALEARAQQIVDGFAEVRRAMFALGAERENSRLVTGDALALAAARARASDAIFTLYFVVRSQALRTDLRSMARFANSDADGLPEDATQTELERLSAKVENEVDGLLTGTAATPSPPDGSA